MGGSRAALIVSVLGVLLMARIGSTQPAVPVEEPTGAAVQAAGPGPAASVEVRLLAPLDGAVVRETRIRLRVALRGPVGQATPRLVAAIDGVSAPFRGIMLTTDPATQAPAGQDETIQELDLMIPPRDCTVSVRAEMLHGDSAAAVVRLRWNGAPFVALPNLYVLSIGVGSYQRPNLFLRYPAKDAWDVAQAFRKQAGRPVQKGGHRGVGG